MTIPQFVHTCVVRTGAGAGNKVLIAVSAWQVDAGEQCPHCRMPLATPDQIALHIYRELTEE